MNDSPESRVPLTHRTHIAGGSHNPYAERSADADATKIAMKYLPMLEKSLHDMGVHVVTGVEIEFDAGKENNKAIINFMRDELEHAREILKETLGDGPKPSVAQMIARKLSKLVGIKTKGKDGRFSAGPVQHAYVDEEGDAEITTRPAPPTKTAHYVRGIKRVLAEISDEARMDLDADGRAPGPSAEHIHQAVGHVERLQLGAREQNKAYGEHINLSLHRVPEGSAPKGAFNLGKANLTRDEGWRQLLAYVICNHTMQDAALFLGGPLTLQRHATSKYVVRDGLGNAVTAQSYEPDGYKVYTTGYEGERYQQPKFQAVHDDQDEDKSEKLSRKESARVEVRIPDSTSNIFLTSLAVLSAVHLAVDTVRKQHKGKIPETLSEHAIDNAVAELDRVHTRCRFYPSTPTVAKERLSTESLVLGTIARLASSEINLGTAQRDVQAMHGAIMRRTDCLFPSGHGRG